MATFPDARIQSILEKATYTVDFTKDVPSGGSITAATATHTPPSGSAGTISCTISTPYVYVTVPAQSVIGVHYIDIVATASDGDTPTVRLPINFVYPTPSARSGMLDLINELRVLTESVPDEYVIAGVPYWTDKQLQTILDASRSDLVFEPAQDVPYQGAGTLTHLEYRTLPNLEQTSGGTSIFYLQGASGGIIGTADYTVDYLRGVILFNADTGGSAIYVNGRSYDLYTAASDIWRRKSGHYAPTAFNFSTDNHSMNREQIYVHCKEMAQYYDSIKHGSLSSAEWERSDTA